MNASHFFVQKGSTSNTVNREVWTGKWMNFALGEQKLSMKPGVKSMFSTICGIVMMSLLTSGAAWADSLGIYTHRQPLLLEPIMRPIPRKQGQRFRPSMPQRGWPPVCRQKKRTKADLVLTVDISG